MENKGSDQIYQEEDYENILSLYWNNGTHQHENPLPIVEAARGPEQNKITNKNANNE